MKSAKYVSAIALATGLVLPITSIPSNAWNIICGVSINLVKSSTPKKWNADSHSLKGIASFYSAVSELQRAELREDGTFANPKSMEKSGLTVVEAAIYEFEQSASHFEAAIKVANANGLGDTKGLDMLKKMQSDATAFHDQMAYSGHLPDLLELQDTTRTIMAFTEYGIKLSLDHLSMKMEGHGQGGPKYKIE